MASETEGITLLSMYGDDEEDEEAIATPPEGEGAGEEAKEISNDDNIRSDRLPLPVLDKPPQILTLPSPIRPKNGADSKTLRRLLPQQRVSLSPPPATVEPAVGRRVSRRAVTIVDYAHDEAAMSPETEEEEVGGGGYVLIGMELRGSDDVTTVAGHSGGTTPVTSQTLTPNSQYECLQPSYAPELSKTKASMSMDCFETEREVGEVETYAAISSDLQKDDPLQKFLPSAITIKCSEELQEKINKFLAYKKVGKSFNADLRKKKDYRNPDFLQHAVRYQDIEQIGTCFGTEVFDPLGYDKSDFYDEIEADMKRELEKKAQERKRSQKIDFVSGGLQSGDAVAPAIKMNNKIPAVGVSTGLNNELQPVSTTVDAARDSRLNKKSKWDKADY